MEVAPGRVVTLEYTMRLASGALLDSTGTCGPMTVLCGAGQLFAPLEARIAGMRAGETREVRIPAGEAYGERRAELVRRLPRDRIPPDLALEVGRSYRLTAPGGKVLRFRLLAVADDALEADFNPPAAGEDLVGSVTVVAVRAPTAAEERRGRA